MPNSMYIGETSVPSCQMTNPVPNIMSQGAYSNNHTNGRLPSEEYQYPMNQFRESFTNQIPYSDRSKIPPPPYPGKVNSEGAVNMTSDLNQKSYENIPLTKSNSEPLSRYASKWNQGNSFQESQFPELYKFNQGQGHDGYSVPDSYQFPQNRLDTERLYGNHSNTGLQPKPSISMFSGYDREHIKIQSFNPKETDWYRYREYFDSIVSQTSWSDQTKCAKLNQY